MNDRYLHAFYTIDGVRVIVEKISEVAQQSANADPEAHAMEDALYEDVLKVIAAGVENSQALAIEALKTQDIKFSRWYE